ncbi:MAG: YfhO family protein [Candidatus Kuenenbacteria bacterium]
MKFIKKELFIIPLLLLFLVLIFFGSPICNNRTLIPFDILSEFDSTSGNSGTPSQNYLISDLVDQFYPNYYFLRQELDNGSFPLWNPYILTGVPFFADSQVGIFEFTHIISYIIQINPIDFFLFSAILNTLLLVLFSYLFFRNNFSKMASLFGALSLAFSGVAIVWVNYALVWTFVWCPFILFCLDKIRLKNDLRFLPLLSIGVVFCVFGGYPQSALIIISLALLYYLFLSKKKEILRIKTLLVIIFIMFGCLMTTFQVGPSWDFIKDSESYDIGRGSRAEISLFQEVSSQLANIGYSTKLFVKRFFTHGVLLFDPLHYGTPINRDYVFPEGDTILNFSEVTVYFGFFGIILALISLIWIKKRIVLFWSVASAVFLGMSFNLPFINPLAYLPIINKISLSRFRIFLVLSLVILAVYGFDKLYLMARRKKIAIASLIACLIIVFNWLSLFYFFHNYNKGVDKELSYLNSYPTVEYLRSHTDFERIAGIGPQNRGFHSPILPNTSMIYKLYDIRGYNPIVSRDYLDIASRYLTRRGSFVLLDAIFDNRSMDLFGIKYVACDKDDCPLGDNSGWINEFEDGSIKIMRNNNFLPRVYIDYSKIYNTEFNVLIDKDVDFDNFGRTADITYYSPNEIKIEYTAEREGVLVLADKYDKGWRAYIDSEEMEVIKVNSIFRGVKVAPGNNEIIFRYLPHNFYIYLTVSVISSFGFIFMTLFVIKKLSTTRKIKNDEMEKSK